MSTSSGVDGAERRTARDVGEVGHPAALRHAGLEAAPELRELGGVQRSSSTFRAAVGELGVGAMLGTALDPLVDELRVRVHGAEDRLDRLRRGEDQRKVMSRKRRAERMVDRAGVLTDEHLLSLGALDAAGRRFGSVIDALRTALAASFGRSGT